MKKKKLLILTFILLTMRLGNTIHALYINNDVEEDRGWLVNLLFDKISWTSLTYIKNDNIFWCKGKTLLMEPFPIEYYGIKNPKDIFNKKNRISKVFIKYTPYLNKKITLKNKRILQGYVTNSCNKEISPIDQKRIISLYNKLTDYTALQNTINSDYIDLYTILTEKINPTEQINKLKSDIFKLNNLKKKLNKLSILNIKILELNTSENKDKKFINFKIEPFKHSVKLDNKKVKMNYLNLYINKDHITNINLEDIKNMSILWKIDNMNWQFNIDYIYNMLFR